MSEATNFPYDVFVSYSHVDKEWVHEWLVPGLEKAGLHVCIDVRDFALGVSSLRNMENAVDKCRHTLLVLSPAWLESEWAHFEALVAQRSDPAGRKGKLIPILFQHCKPPGHLSVITYADFTEHEKRDIALSRVVEAIKGQSRLSGVSSIESTSSHVQSPQSTPYRDDPFSFLSERLEKLSKRTPVPIACIGGVYLDILIQGIELQENQRHHLDFTREVPITVQTRPGGSIYYVARYLSELGLEPIVASHVGDGSRNGFADSFFNKIHKDGHETIAQGITRQRAAATAVTIHFVHPDPKQASAMYTDRYVLKNFGWQQASEILQNCGRNNNQIYDSGVIYVAGFFKTDLYRHLDENLRGLRRNGAVIFLDHGRLEADQGPEGRNQILGLAEALRLVDVYFSTKEEFSQLMREIARDMPERVAQTIREDAHPAEIVDQIAQAAKIYFPSIMLIKDRTRRPSVHSVGVRKANGEYEWKNITVSRESYPIREYSVGSSNAFNAGFIAALLGLRDEINIQTIATCAEKAQLRMINIESGKRIDDESSQ